MYLGLLLALFCALQVFLPLRTAVQIGADEGFELTKATLCLHGHKLYTEVWNDQPPLHTFLITQILKHISPSVLGPRLLTSAFTLVLLSSVFLLIERLSGGRVAFIASLLVLVSPGFLELTASCMLEVPALATALAGICLVARFGRTQWVVSDIVAGVLFGLSLQMKLINLVWTPLVALIVLLQCASESVLMKALEGGGRSGALASVWDIRRNKHFYLRLIAFGCALMISWIAVDFLIDGGAYAANFHQSWKSHFGKVKTIEYGSPSEHVFRWALLARNWDTTVFAVIGISFAIIRCRKNLSLLIPLFWMAWSLAVFSNHKPWWPYYYIHLGIPFCWCAAFGVMELVTAFRGNWTAKFSRLKKSAILTGIYLFIATAALWMSARVVLQVANARRLPRIYSSLVIAEAQRYKPFCKWLYTDDIVFSFHTGIPMPPNLAVIPLKRLWSGDMSAGLIAQEVARYKPELVLLNEKTLAAPFQELLERDYRIVYQDSGYRLYARPEVIASAEETWTR